MSHSSPKSLSGILTFPRGLSSILISVAALAFFLVVASRLLISYPISSSVQGYVLAASLPVVFPLKGNDTKFQHSKSSQVGHEDMVMRNTTFVSEVPYDVAAITSSSTNATREVEETAKSPIAQAATKGKEAARSIPGFPKYSRNIGSEAFDNDSVPSNLSFMVTPPYSVLSETSKNVDSGSCDLYHGKWVYDPVGPLYTNNTCPVITQMQNCQGNGRPDRNYENWRWKPDHCDLPRFDAKKFLELMRGKTLAFIGDSVTRNQMESMLCILWQVETPKNRGNRHMQRWHFRSTSTMIVRIWSSWLVHKTSEPIEFAPEGVVKIHLDAPDEDFMEHLPKFDVVVLSSGHWFAKQSVYVLNGTIVGGQLWWPDKTRKMLINNVDAFGISVETILTSIASRPDYKGLTIVRSFSPDHYEGGAWNTGGSCTGKDRPATELVRNGFTDVMHEKQVAGFDRAVKKARNGSKLRFMDITDVFGYRHDGHPGPFRSPDPNKKTKRGPNGEPPPQDCLHWCMPGPIDAWNELVLEIIRREFEGA